MTMTSINKDIAHKLIIIYRSYARDKGWDDKDRYVIAEIHREVFANLTHNIIENIHKNNNISREEIRQELNLYVQEQFVQFTKT